MKVNAETRRVH